MKAVSLKISFGLMLLILTVSSCQKSGSSSSSGSSILSTDETADAVKLVDDANSDLKKIKAIYKANQGRVEELQTAMTNKETDKVKSTADDLVFQINDGMELAKQALTKIEEAENMNINDTYKEYLGKKREAISTQLEAFEYRRQSAQLLRDAFGGKDVKEIDKVKAVFKEKDDKFQKLMDEGREQSQEANEIAKESLKRKA